MINILSTIMDEDCEDCIMAEERCTKHKASIGAIMNSINKRISSINLNQDSNILYIIFKDDTKLAIHDSKQDCCENRYMRTDDNLSIFKEAKLLDIRIERVHDSEMIDGMYDDMAFLIIATDKGDITIANHNEHNGYYAGFSIVANVE